MLTGHLSTGAGLAVTGRIRDIGEKVLRYSVRKGSSRSPVTAKFSSFLLPSRRTLLQIQCKKYYELMTINKI